MNNKKIFHFNHECRFVWTSYRIRKGISRSSRFAFNLTSKGDFDSGDRKLCKIADPVENFDCVNLKTLREEIKELNEEELKLINQEKTLNLEVLAIAAYSSV